MTHDQASNSTDNSTHDPLCPNSKGSCCPWMGDCDCQCRCELITQVRADERQRTAT